jgi:anti-anti-sigma factor
MTREQMTALERATRGLLHFGAASVVGADGGLRMEIRGYFNGDAANAVMPTILSLVKQWDGAPSLVFDARGLEYISSLGIGVLTMARAVARQRGISFSLENPQPGVVRVIELLGVASYMSMKT